MTKIIKVLFNSNKNTTPKTHNLLYFHINLNKNHKHSHNIDRHNY